MFGSSQWMYNSGSDFTIDQSLRFDGNSTLYLRPHTPGNRKKWTYSVWCKGFKDNSSKSIFSSIGSAWSSGLVTQEVSSLRFNSGRLEFQNHNGSGGSYMVIRHTEAYFRDPAAWYHVVCVFDSDNDNEEDRAILYVNGVRMTEWYSYTPMSKGFEGYTNAGYGFEIGNDARDGVNTHFYDGYLAEAHFVDEQVLTPDYFGTINEDYGNWVPKKYTGSYGDNGFYLDFSGTYYNDKSGNGNNFTSNNMASTDVVLDTPSNNFATYNPLSVSNFSNITLSEGALRSTETNVCISSSLGTMFVTSGKWYCEFRSNAAGDEDAIGIFTDKFNTSTTSFYNPNFIVLLGGHVYYSSYDTSAGTSDFGSGDIIRMKLDLDNQTVAWAINGGSFAQVNLSSYDSHAAGEYWTFGVRNGCSGGDGNHDISINFGQDSSFAGLVTRQNNSDDNGVGDFYYSPPSGYLALCTQNLPEPAVIPTQQFGMLQWQGNRKVRDIGGLDFQPGLMWAKNRTAATHDWHVYDEVRGDQYLSKLNLSAVSGASGENAGSVHALNSDGFRLGLSDALNENGSFISGWFWKGGGSTSTNTNGSISSTVSVNTDGGFSIARYWGDGSNGTVGHGLSQAPNLIITKSWNQGTVWNIWHKDFGEDAAIETWSGSISTASTSKYITNVGSSTYQTGNDISLNQSSAYGYIAYCWHDVEGYSKSGTYIATNSSGNNGPFVHTGFRPAMVLITNGSRSQEAILLDAGRDQINPTSRALQPNSTATESAWYTVDSDGNTVDFLSNGFKVRASGSGVNYASGDTMFYMAFAEVPMKYANARGISQDRFTEVETGYTIDQSLRLNNSDSSYLNRTPSGASNRKNWTWSGWVKLGNIQEGVLFGADNTSNQTLLRIRSQGVLQLGRWNGSGYDWDLKTSNLLRDPASWYHITAVLDTTNNVSSERARLYINGNRVTDFGTESYPSLSHQGDINSTYIHGLGAFAGGSSPQYFDGYIADVHFIDGQSLEPDNFGYNDPTYGDWRPKEYSDGNPYPDYGPNGFHLPFTGGIENWAVEFDGSGDYLNVSDNADLDMGSSDYTIEAWFYVRSHGSYGTAFFSKWGDNASNLRSYGFNYRTAISGVTLAYSTDGSGENLANQAYSFPLNTWVHVADVRNGSTRTGYINGEPVITQSVGTATYKDTSSPYYIGRFETNTGYDLDGYVSNLRIVKGTALYKAAFTPSPSEKLTAITNTVLLTCQDSTFVDNSSNAFTINSGGNATAVNVSASTGSDHSGNLNNWKLNNMDMSDVVNDSPTNNFCTLNSIYMNDEMEVSEGNLKVTNTIRWDWHTITSTMAMSSGKWYWECFIDNSGRDQHIGGIYETHVNSYYVFTDNQHPVRTGASGADAYAVELSGNGDGYQSQIDGTASFESVTGGWADSDIIGFALDCDNNTFKIYKNNTLVKTYTGLNSSTWGIFSSLGDHPSDSGYPEHTYNFGQDSSFVGAITAQGNQDSNGIGDFYYTPPTGYLALCTSNLPNPTVVPKENFGVITWSGLDDDASRSITGVGFQPDLVWTKIRTQTWHHLIYDSIRGGGPNSELLPHSTVAEGGGDPQSYDWLSTFDQDGFSSQYGGSNTADYFNRTGNTYVAWNWKSATSNSTNTNGSITSTVRANQDAGFSIVKYTGTSATNPATVGHGLSQTPELILFKNIDVAVDWQVYSKSIATSQKLYLNSTSSAVTTSNWNSTAPTSSVFTVNGTGSGAVNGNGEDVIAYCFHSVPGYSKVGSYIGNGSNDGVFVYTGFTPKWIMFKTTSASSPWYILDTERNQYNLTDLALRADANDPDNNNLYFGDFVSNGFKARDGGGANGNGVSAIYIAFAEYPFKRTNAR